MLANIEFISFTFFVLKYLTLIYCKPLLFENILFILVTWLVSNEDKSKLVIDDSEEARDRLEINAQIYLKFMPNVEYINIGLIATPQGVSFEDI